MVPYIGLQRSMWAYTVTLSQHLVPKDNESPAIYPNFAF